MRKKIIVKKNLWILVICIIVVLVATALIVFRDDLIKEAEKLNIWRKTNKTDV